MNKSLFIIVLFLLNACGGQTGTPQQTPASAPKASSAANTVSHETLPAVSAAAAPSAVREAETAAPQLVQSARRQIGLTVHYDPAYTSIAYPMGDVPMERGVCTDVVIRALREQEMDLQQLVHRDMKRHFSVYPKRWGLKRPDPNIDHRRVPNLITFFTRQGWAVKKQGDFQPGDIVTWELGASRLPHIGIVSERKNDSTPLIIHNIGRGTQEEDILFKHPITGHFRLPVR